MKLIWRVKPPVMLSDNAHLFDAPHGGSTRTLSTNCWALCLSSQDELSLSGGDPAVVKNGPQPPVDLDPRRLAELLEAAVRLALQVDLGRDGVDVDEVASSDRININRLLLILDVVVAVQ